MVNPCSFWSNYGILVRNTASGATHILTSQQLSGSKTEKFLTARSKVKSHVVRPEWLFDSVKAGTKKNEWNYSVIKNEAQGSLDGFLNANK
jgi:hypothetical protein